MPAEEAGSRWPETPGMPDAKISLVFYIEVSFLFMLSTLNPLQVMIAPER
jgi:hypothetical protein